MVTSSVAMVSSPEPVKVIKLKQMMAAFALVASKINHTLVASFAFVINLPSFAEVTRIHPSTRPYYCMDQIVPICSCFLILRAKKSFWIFADLMTFQSCKGFVENLLLAGLRFHQFLLQCYSYFIPVLFCSYSLIIFPLASISPFLWLMLPPKQFTSPKSLSCFRLLILS